MPIQLHQKRSLFQKHILGKPLKHLLSTVVEEEAMVLLVAHLQQVAEALRVAVSLAIIPPRRQNMVVRIRYRG